MSPEFPERTRTSTWLRTTIGAAALAGMFASSLLVGVEQAGQTAGETADVGRPASISMMVPNLRDALPVQTGAVPGAGRQSVEGPLAHMQELHMHDSEEIQAPPERAESSLYDRTST
jgi:hypothetical protein